MLWWGDGAGWVGLVVMILAMAGFWALVVGATIAIFRGVGDDPAVPRRRSGAVRAPRRVRDVPGSSEKAHEQATHARPELRSDSSKRH